MSSPIERNRANALAFYDLAFNKCRPREAVETYVGEVYQQHNPEVPDGKRGFIQYFTDLARQFPGKRADFVRTIAEGDLVVVHSRQTWPGCPDYTSIDIFRCDDNGKIVEHWDVMQEIPEGG